MHIGTFSFLDNTNRQVVFSSQISNVYHHYTYVKNCHAQTSSYPGRIPASRRLSQEYFTCTDAVGTLERKYWNKLKPTFYS